MLLSSLLLLALGYLLGSMPNGYLAGRWLMGIDLRQCGAGSTGAIAEHDRDARTEDLDRYGLAWVSSGLAPPPPP